MAYMPTDFPVDLTQEYRTRFARAFDAVQTFLNPSSSIDPAVKKRQKLVTKQERDLTGFDAFVADEREGAKADAERVVKNFDKDIERAEIAADNYYKALEEQAKKKRQTGINDAVRRYNLKRRSLFYRTVRAVGPGTIKWTLLGSVAALAITAGGFTAEFVHPGFWKDFLVNAAGDPVHASVDPVAAQKQQMISAAQSSDTDSLLRAMTSQTVSKESTNTYLRALLGNHFQNDMLLDMNKTTVLFGFDTWDADHKVIGTDIELVSQRILMEKASTAGQGLLEAVGLQSKSPAPVASNESKGEKLPQLRQFTPQGLLNIAALDIIYSINPDPRYTAAFDYLADTYAEKGMVEGKFGDDESDLNRRVLAYVRENRETYKKLLAERDTEEDRRQFAKDEAVFALKNAIKSSQMSADIAEARLKNMSSLVTESNFNHVTMHAFRLADLSTGVALSQLAAISAMESGGNPNAISPTKCAGLFQFCQGTWIDAIGIARTQFAPDVEKFTSLVGQDSGDAVLLNRLFSLERQYRVAETRKEDASQLKAEMIAARENPNINAFLGAIYQKYGWVKIPEILRELGASPSLYNRDDPRNGVLQNILGVGSVKGSAAGNIKHSEAGLANWIILENVTANGVLPDSTVGPNESLLGGKTLINVRNYLSSFEIPAEVINALADKLDPPASSASAQNPVEGFFKNLGNIFVNTHKAPGATVQLIGVDGNAKVAIVKKQTPSLSWRIQHLPGIVHVENLRLKSI